MKISMGSALSPAEQTEKYNLAVGQLVGNYRIERLIDEGGMGAVFAAVHKDIGRRAAVKVLMRSYASDPEFAARFLNEARAVNLIGHPGVVEIFEFGRIGDDTPYIIMEYLAGESIQARLTGGGQRDFRTILEWVRQMALALAAAHKQGVIHRDLKPQNVFLIPDPLAPGGERVKILDFGIAKLTDAVNPSAALTRTGATMGSPLYMAPEQCYEMGTVTDRADVYGLGILLYELIAGRTPFVSELPAEVMVMQVKNSPPPLRQLNPKVPTNIVSLVDVMLRKAPAERPSMEEVAQRADRMLSGGGLTGGWQRVPGSGPAAGGRTTLFAVSAVAVVALCTVAFLLVRERVPGGGPSKKPIAATGKPQSGVNKPPPPKPVAPKLPTTIRHEMTSEPPGARIVDVDSGEELGTTPATLKLQRSDEPQKLVLRRSGYQDKPLVIDRTKDGETTQKLSAVKKPKTPSTPSILNNPKHDELLAPNL